MPTRRPLLTDAQIGALDTFVGNVLDAYKNGLLGKLDAVLAIGHVTSAVDKGNEAEYLSFSANWHAPGPEDAAAIFLAAVLKAGLRISNFGLFRSVVADADDWRSEVVAITMRGRKDGVRLFFATPHKVTTDVVLKLAEFLDEHGFDSTQRRMIIQNVDVAVS